VAAALLIAAVMALLGACAAQPFRLHILADSNDTEDQQVKLKVRDAVLEVTKDGILECKNAAEAEEYIEKNLGIIIATANETLEERGFDYKASAVTGNFHFPERSYKGVTYPEGDYEALKVTLGSGEGNNWWCVMFPPLCISEITDAKDYEYTSFFAELWEAIFGK
jgi:stage II sporulation protein R